MNIIITMKKIIFIAMLISSVGMCFANQLPHSAESNNGNISFRMPDMTVRLSDEYDEYDDIYRLYDPQQVMSASIAERAIGIVLSVLSVIPHSVFIAMNAIMSPFVSAYISPVWVYGSQMTIAGVMMIYLGVKKSQLMKQGVDAPRYKYEMSKAMRNIGIVTLSTSVIPLAVMIPYLVIPAGGIGFILAPVNGLAFLAQLVLGITFLAVGIAKMDEWAEIVFPEVSVVHDDKKGYNDGYAVNVGVRIKI